jgi:hypothetical protein
VNVQATLFGLYAAAPAFPLIILIEGESISPWAWPVLVLLNLGLIALFVHAQRHLKQHPTFVGMRPWAWRWLPPLAYLGGLGVAGFVYALRWL